MKKRSILAIALFAGLAITGTIAPAQDAAQSASGAQPQTQSAKKPKVWTDDNIASIRTPADNFEIQQEQEEEAQRAQAAKAAAQAAEAAGPAPKTVQQADSMIAAKKQQLVDQQQYLQRLQKDVNNPNNSSLDQLRLNWRMKSHTASEQQTQAQLKQLEDQKAALAKAAAEAAKNKKKSSDSGDSGQQ
jgi:short subunit dehydrogenase-like uncharacterized protein